MKYLEKEHNWDIQGKNNYDYGAYSYGNHEIRKHLNELYEKETIKNIIS
jgi:hypothetical protein